MGTHAWRDRPPSGRSKANAQLKDQIQRIHSRSRGTYGAPRVQAELVDEGQRVSRKRVARLMREAGLAGGEPTAANSDDAARAQQPTSPGSSGSQLHGAEAGRASSYGHDCTGLRSTAPEKLLPNPTRSDHTASRFEKFSSNNCLTETGSDPQHCANASIATSTSQGKIDLPLIRANGPSDSVKTRARGIRLVNSIPRLLLNITGPTLNQHPRAIARSSSRTVPENQ